MKDTIKHLKKLLACKSAGELAPILGVTKATIYRSVAGNGGQQFDHACKILEMVLTELSEERLEHCQGMLQLMFSE